MNIRLIRLESLAQDRCLAEFECVPPAWLPNSWKGEVYVPRWEPPPTWERISSLGEEPVYRVRAEFEANRVGDIAGVTEVMPDDPTWKERDRSFRDQHGQPSDLFGQADGSAEDIRRVVRAIGSFLDAA